MKLLFRAWKDLHLNLLLWRSTSPPCQLSPPSSQCAVPFLIRAESSNVPAGRYLPARSQSLHPECMNRSQTQHNSQAVLRNRHLPPQTMFSETIPPRIHHPLKVISTLYHHPHS